MGIVTSAGMLREVFGRCIQLGRQYGRSKNKADFYEGETNDRIVPVYSQQ